MQHTIIHREEIRDALWQKRADHEDLSCVNSFILIPNLLLIKELIKYLLQSSAVWVEYDISSEIITSSFHSTAVMKQNIWM